MTNTKKLLSGFAILVAVTGAACGVQTSSDVKAASIEKSAAVEDTLTVINDGSKIKDRGYVKPGAAVTMDHNFKGYVQPGASGSVQVTFRPSASSGSMRVEANTKGGLALKSDSKGKTFQMEKSGAYTMDVGFSTQAPGAQYINFQVYTTDSMGQTLGRYFTVPIQVGDPALNPPAKQNVTLETTPSGQRIVVMEAEETITQSE